MILTIDASKLRDFIGSRTTDETPSKRIEEYVGNYMLRAIVIGSAVFSSDSIDITKEIENSITLAVAEKKAEEKGGDWKVSVTEFCRIKEGGSLS